MGLRGGARWRPVAGPSPSGRGALPPTGRTDAMLEVAGGEVAAGPREAGCVGDARALYDVARAEVREGGGVGDDVAEDSVRAVEHVGPRWRDLGLPHQQEELGTR